MTAILALDAALGGCSAGVVADDVVLAERHAVGGRGTSAPLASMAQAVLEEAGLPANGLAMVAVTIGPGSFTGLRAALALAHGIGLAAGIPVVGVTVGEAMAEPGTASPGRALWVAIDSKRGHVFIDRDGGIANQMLDALPMPNGPVAVAGDAAVAIASRLAAAGADVQLLEARRPRPLGIAAAALRRQQAGLPPRPAQPLYIDPPEARPGPRGRPAPL